MSLRKQSPVGGSDIDASARQTRVERIVVDENFVEVSRETVTVDAPYCYVLIIGNSKHTIGHVDESAMLAALEVPQGENSPRGARLIKLDPVTALPIYGSDHSPHYVSAAQVSRLRTAGLIPQGG